ncbi:prolow-density lipoprotein receptor-related protein 1 isoform X1 [Tachysurus fulvidraco]|uniref:prolow-density lipoprotein receptor-related protein 1 isoform X1 n=1 Tax=Tachysurus fulvidraco TaxID=1234273 RepID=UPI001FEF44FA|nr:prolow-density lipoprotein receptor-related protein 1 isoform X1 [Tachysurus fulvidraco]
MRAVHVLWTLWTLSIAAWTLSALLPGRSVSAQKPLHCLFGTRPCKDNSACVSHSHVCDGDKDCADGSDEEECSTECSAGQFQCAHGKMCIEKKQLCDGVAQCQDRSDEVDCFNPEEGCFHRCDKKHCLSDSFICDGEADCGDGSDEVDCGEESCRSTEFQCRSGQCVSINMRCDGSSDCRDHSDEDGCISQVACADDQQRCQNNQQCVLQEWLCDGENDCRDTSDEQNCTVSAVQCGEFQWPCTSQTQCVPQSWHCDGTKDCTDESDEAVCESEYAGEPVSCPPDQFQCDSSECLDPSVLCNGVPDCADKSDEGGACKSDACSDQSQCAQDCYSTPRGKRCWCKKGYEPVANGAECVDVDECVKTPDVCDHSCVNSDGSYECSCNQGYVLEPDGHRCKITGGAHLLASIQSDIFLISLTSITLEVLSSEKQPVLSLDYDWKEQKVYWINMDAEAVMWSTLDQTSRGTLIQGVKTECVAVDWVGRNLYWTDRTEGQINAVGLVGFKVEPVVIVEDDVDELRSLALLPQKGVMFWSQTGDEAKIESAGMDGSNRRVLVRRSLHSPMGLAVDLLQDRLYWTDKKMHCIGSATLDGDDVKILQLREIRSPFSLAVFEDFVYWTDTRRRTIQKAQKVTGKQQQVLLKRHSQPFDLKVIHALLQPIVENPCVLKHCSHLCVLAPGLGAVCKCPPQLLLKDDEQTCSKPEDESFLLLISNTSISQVQVPSRITVVGLQDWPQHQRFELPEARAASALDLVLREQMLYIWDAAAGSLDLFKLKHAVTWHGILFKLRKGSITAMAVDYITLNVFWSSKDQPGVYVTSADGAHTALIIDKGMVRSVALHPPTGQLCFSNSELQGTRTSLECAYMDGGNRTVVWDGAINPVSLRMSNDGTKLYWVDTSLGLINSVRTDGSEHKVLRIAEPVVAFTLANSVLIWLTRTDSIKCWFSEDHKRIVRMWFKVKAEVLDVKAFSKSSQDGTNFCSTGNGGCSQLCLPFPGGRTCRCGRGFITNTEMSCVTDPRCPSGTKPCLHGDQCIPLEQFCDGNPDCADDSDEICVQAKSAEGIKPKVHPNSTSTIPPSPRSSDAPNLVKNGDSSKVSPKSSRPFVPDAVDRPDSNDMKVESVDSESCGTRMCSGNGECVLLGEQTTCECTLGYGGESCELEVGGIMQGPVLYATVGLAVGIIVLGMIIGIIQKKKAANQRQARPIVRETSLRDLSNRAEPTPTHQNSRSTDPENPEVH